MKRNSYFGFGSLHSVIRLILCFTITLQFSVLPGSASEGTIPGRAETCESLKTYRDHDLIEIWDQAAKNYQPSVNNIAAYERQKAEFLNDLNNYKWKSAGSLIAGAKLLSDVLWAILSKLPPGYVIRVGGKVSIKLMRRAIARFGPKKVVNTVKSGKKIAEIAQHRSSEQMKWDILELMNPIADVINDIKAISDDINTLDEIGKNDKQIIASFRSLIRTADRNLKKFRAIVEEKQKAFKMVNTIKTAIDELLQEYCVGEEEKTDNENQDGNDSPSDGDIESLISHAGDEVIADARASRGRSGARLDARRARHALDAFSHESDRIITEMQMAYLQNALKQMERLAESEKKRREEAAQCPNQTAALQRRIQQLEQRRRGANVGACTAAKLERDAWAAQAEFFRSCPLQDPNGAYASETNRLVSMADERVGDVCVN